jgi:tetratricopeptide (TPR) repeat protein
LHGAAAAIFIDDPVLRAEHLDRSGDPEAARAYLDAAKAQAILFRQDQAIALAARGLALATKAHDTFELAMLVGALQLDAGRGTEALEAYVQALAVSGEDADRCRTLLGCASSNRLIARVDDAFSSLAEAEPLAVARSDDRALAEIHYLRGNLHFCTWALSRVPQRTRIGSRGRTARRSAGMASPRPQRFGGCTVYGLPHGNGAFSLCRLC